MKAAAKSRHAFAALGLAACLVAGCTETPANAPWLVAGDTVERELLAGESHSYRVELAGGDYFEAAVTQRGVDVAVTLYDADDRALLAVDYPNGPEGPEPLVVLVEDGGFYRLEVRAMDTGAGGRYRLAVQAAGPPREGDRERAAAVELYAAAEALRRQDDPAARRRALDGYRQALASWQSLREPLLAARAERRIGQLCFAQGDLRCALASFDRALAGFRRHANGWELAALLTDAGNAWRQVGEPGRALALFREALQVSEEVGNRLGTASARNNLGLLHDAAGELEEALADYEQALTVWRELGHTAHAATTRHNVGVCYTSLGRTAEGLDFLEQALATRRAAGDERGQAVTLTALGWARFTDRDLAGAVAAYTEALALRRAVGDRQGEAVTLDLLGSAQRELGRRAEARAAFAEALSLAVGSNPLNEAHTRDNLGRLHLELDEPEAALDHHRRALALFREVGYLPGEASALAGIAAARRRLGDLNAARARLAEALAVVESLRSRLQNEALRRSYLASRQDHYAAYVDLLLELDRATPGQGYAAQALAAHERSRARSLLDSLAAARAGVRRGADPAVLAQERELRSRINAREARRLDPLSPAADPAAAAEDERDLRALLLEYEQLQAEIRAGSAQAGAFHDPEPLSAAQIQEVLDDDTLLLVYALGEERSVLWVVDRTSLASFFLPPAAVIDDLARQLYEVMPLSPQRGFRPQTVLAAAALSEAILAPAVAHLGRKRLAIVGDGALHFVPFGALPVPGQEVPLVSEHEVVVLPSASVLALLRRARQERAPPPGLLAMIADPVFRRDDPRLTGDGAEPLGPAASEAEAAIPADLLRSSRELGIDGFARLPFSGREADAILALAPAAARFAATGFDASRETVLSGVLGRYRIVHFATHGLVSSRHPDLSGVVLSLVDAGGRPRDGFLRVHELFDLDLPADLVVLSACSTALGQEVRGEGLLGLTRGFFYAGASRVVVSLWDVDDQATAELMARFYRALLGDGLPPAAALRAAQLSLRAEPRWQAPFYWAGFTLQGDWRQIPAQALATSPPKPEQPGL